MHSCDFCFFALPNFVFLQLGYTKCLKIIHDNGLACSPFVLCVVLTICFYCVCVCFSNAGILAFNRSILAFCRMVHAFSCIGLSETQYQSFGEAGNIGYVMDKTIDTSGLLS